MRRGVFLMAVLSLGLMACKPIGERYSTKEVRFEIGGHTLVIPRNYLGGWQNAEHPIYEKVQHPSSLRIELLLPDMEPMTENNKALFEVSQRRYVDVNLRYQDTAGTPDSPHRKDQSHLIERYKDDPNMSPPERIKGGLYVIKRKPGKKGDNVYFYRRKDGIYPVLSCTQPDRAPNPNCQAHFEPWEKVTAFYRFSLTHINHVKTIDTQVKILLKQFKKDR